MLRAIGAFAELGDLVLPEIPECSIPRGLTWPRVFVVGRGRTCTVRIPKFDGVRSFALCSTNPLFGCCPRAQRTSMQTPPPF